jgi:hypothetical protein
MQNFNTFTRDEVAWQTWQEITNRQFRALLREDQRRQRAQALRRVPRWKRMLCAVFGIEPKLPLSFEHSNLPGGFP